MAGLVPAIHAFFLMHQGVDARDKRGMTEQMVRLDQNMRRRHDAHGLPISIAPKAARNGTGIDTTTLSHTTRAGITIAS